MIFANISLCEIYTYIQSVRVHVPEISITRRGRKKNRENFRSLYFRGKERGRGSWSSQLHDTLIEPIYNILNFIAVQGSFPQSAARREALSVAGDSSAGEILRY